MPNWCYTWMSISGDEQEIAVLDDNFKKAKSFNGTTSDFGESWLGRLVEYVGQDWQKVSCRGAVVSYGYAPGEINLSVESAWSPQLRPILLMVEKFAPNSEITYYAEEPGCELYLTNDSDTVDTYRVDSIEDDLDPGPEPFSRDELKEWLETEVLNKKGGFASLIKEALSTKDIFIHQYEYCDVWEL